MSGPNLYFEETFKKEKKFRYCLKFLQVSDGELTIPSKQSSDIWLNMKNETNNKVQLLESEKKNLRDHLDFVIKKLEKLHKNLMWNIHLGQAAILSSDLTATPGGETNIALLPGKFNLKNPKTYTYPKPDPNPTFGNPDPSLDTRLIDLEFAKRQKFIFGCVFSIEYYVKNII